MKKTPTLTTLNTPTNREFKSDSDIHSFLIQGITDKDFNTRIDSIRSNEKIQHSLFIS